GLALLDLLADAGIPGTVASAHKILQTSVLANGGGGFETAGEGIHAGNVGVKQVNRLEAFAAHLGIKVQSARLESAHLEDREHDLRSQVDVGGELIGIPPHQLIARVRIDGPERSCRGRYFQFVLHGMASESSMVGLDVELEMVEQVVFTQEI